MQTDRALENLANWTMLTHDQMAELMSWTGEKVGNVRMRFRNEDFVSRALRSPDVRGCPVCLRSDIARNEGPPLAAMVMRGHWLMREANICVEHAHPLVKLWSEEKTNVRYDVGAQLEAILPALRVGAYDQPSQAPSAYDLWLDKRLETGSDDTALKDQGLFAATTFCRLLGRVRLADFGQEIDLTEGSEHAVGFEIASSGTEAIRTELDRLAANAIGPGQEPKTAFGRMYYALGREYLKDDSFAMFRQTLRECILEHWPYRAGDILLGQVVESRRKHSIRSAADETGVGEKLLRQLLVEAGAIAEDDPRPNSRLIFDALQHLDLLTEIPTRVGPIAMQNAIGATKPELIALEQERLLIPRTHIATVKNVWRIEDGQSFVANLQALAVPVPPDDDDWETLLLARKRTRVSLTDMIAAIERGDLVVGAREGVKGFHGIVVQHRYLSKGTFDRSRSKPTDDGTLQSAAAFGRSVGLRDHGTFVKLIEAGHVAAHAQLNPATNRMQYWMNPSHIADFRARFVTPTTLHKETGLHRNTIYSLLEAARVVPFSTDGQDFGSIFLRAEVARVPQFAALAQLPGSNEAKVGFSAPNF